MKKLLVILLVLAMGMLVFGTMSMSTGCEEEEVDAGRTVDPGTDATIDPTVPEYYYVLIDNTGGSTADDTPGVDIDYVALIGPDNSACYADTIGSATYIGGGAANGWSDAFNALDPDDCPDSSPWPQCFVSLGEDGSLSVGFESCPGGILPGDLIEVGEIMGGTSGEESCLLSLCCDIDCASVVPLGEGEDIFSYEIYEADLAECDG